MKNHLQQQVAKLFRKFCVVAAFQRFENLIGFLNQIGSKRQMSLLDVPRAAVRSPEARLKFYQALKPHTGSLGLRSARRFRSTLRFRSGLMICICGASGLFCWPARSLVL